MSKADLLLVQSAHQQQSWLMSRKSVARSVSQPHQINRHFRGLFMSIARTVENKNTKVEEISIILTRLPSVYKRMVPNPSKDCVNSTSFWYISDEQIGLRGTASLAGRIPVKSTEAKPDSIKIPCLPPVIPLEYGHFVG